MMPYVLVALAVVGVCVGLYYLARFMKGSLKIELARDAASSEELFSGTVALQAKKQIHGLLKVSLVGREQHEKARSSKNNRKEWVEVYRYDHVLEEARTFEPGFSETYSFDLLAPTVAEVSSGAAKLQAAAASSDNAGLKMAAGLVGFLGGKIHWHIESRLDAKGVDLYTKEKCEVNLR